MRTYVLGDPKTLFTEAQPDLSRVSDAAHLLELLRDREALIVADASLLLKAGESLSHTLDTCPAAVVVVGTMADVTPALAAFPSIPAVLVAPVSTLALERASRFARESAGRQSALSTLEIQLARRNVEMSELNKIGAALSAERDIDRLLALILSKSRHITSADAGSLYLVEKGVKDGEPDALKFVLPQNDSVTVAFPESRIPLDETSIAGYVALKGTPVNVACGKGRGSRESCKTTCSR